MKPIIKTEWVPSAYRTVEVDHNPIIKVAVKPKIRLIKNRIAGKK